MNTRSILALMLEPYSQTQINRLKIHLQRRMLAPAKEAGLGVVYDLTYWCNLSCKGCGVYAKHYNRAGKLKPSEAECTTSDVVSILTKLKRHLCNNNISQYFINFGGGEPFMRTDIFEILHAACEMFGRDHIGVDSNGSFLFKDDLIRIAELVSYLGISLDGPKDYHDWWRQGESRADESSFDLAVRAIKEALAIPALANNLEVSSVATKNNLSELPTLVEYIADLGVKHYSVHRSMAVGRLAQCVEIIPSAQEYLRLLITILERSEALNIEVHFHHSIESIYATLLLGIDTFSSAKTGEPDRRSSIGIDPNGEVFFDPWCMVKPWNLLSGGSIRDFTEFEEIVASGILSLAREYSRQDVRCEGCRMPCSGGSRIAAATMKLHGTAGKDISLITLTQIMEAMAARDPACPLCEKGPDQ